MEKKYVISSHNHLATPVRNKMGNTSSSSTTSYSVPSRPFDKHGDARSCFRAMVVLPGRKIQNSTTLMQLILLKDWQRVLIRATLFPHEVNKPCTVKLYGIYWKLFPLHLACALKPPPKVVSLLLREGLGAKPVYRRKQRFRLPNSKSFPVPSESTEDRKVLLSQRDNYGSFPDDSSMSTTETNKDECPWTFGGNAPKGSIISMEQSIGDKSCATPTIDGSTIRGTSLCSFLDKTGVVLQLTESGGVSPMPVNIPKNDTTSMTETKNSLELAPDSLLRTVAGSRSLLPIHIACLYQASPSVIQLLLQDYPMGALSSILGMLPVHLVAAGWMILPIESSHVATPFSFLKADEVWSVIQVFRVMQQEFPEVLTAKSSLHGMSPLEYIEEKMEIGLQKDECIEFIKYAKDKIALHSENHVEVIQDDEGNTEMVPTEIHCLNSTISSSIGTMITPSESVLYNLLLERNWNEAMSAIELNPELAREWHYGIDKAAASEDDPVLWKRLGLHLACTVGAPSGLIDALIQSYPEAVGHPDPHNGSIPLHLACQFGASLPVIRSLLKHRSASTKAVDARGRLPLHCAVLSAASYAAVELLVQHDPSSVLCPDQDGKTPLQYAHYSYPEGSPIVGLLEVVWM